jgi:CheY-like chemotaxis protein
VATTILAVDDSATMRKILEITFAGTEFNVVTVDRVDAALQKVQGEAFGLVISDITLAPTNGYDFCKQVKQAAPSTPVLLLSSRQNPYDNAAGAAAGADDHIDKPFDTQQLIDRVLKLLREGVGAAPTQAQPAPPPASTNARARTLLYGGPQAGPIPGAPAPAPVAAAPAPTPAQVGGATLPSAAARGMGFGAGNPMAKPAAAQPAPAARPAVAPAAAAPAPAAARPVAAAAPAVAAAVNGHLAAKIGELGLTPAQAEAVMALSREVIERVVWEVVPVLAETLIKEEILRLTK